MQLIAQKSADGIIRTRYRNAFTRQELLTPGEVHGYAIDLQSVSHVFKKGHRVPVEISGSNFSNYDRNPNPGRRFGEDAELQIARQTIRHNGRFASHVMLSVVER